MRQLALFALALALLTPLAAGAQNLAANAPQRQAILELEYLLNQPGVPPARAAQLQAQITQLETQANGTETPAAPGPRLRDVRRQQLAHRVSPRSARD